MRGSDYASLRSQIIRAAMSIPTNIVEGREKTSEKEFGRFLQYAISSTSELEYHLMSARDIGKLPLNDFQLLMGELVEVRKMLHGLINRLTNSRDKTTAEDESEPPKG
jgi:four helix bundle protein